MLPQKRAILVSRLSLANFSLGSNKQMKLEISPSKKPRRGIETREYITVTTRPMVVEGAKLP